MDMDGKLTKVNLRAIGRDGIKHDGSLSVDFAIDCGSSSWKMHDVFLQSRSILQRSAWRLGCHTTLGESQVNHILRVLEMPAGWSCAQHSRPVQLVCGRVEMVVAAKARMARHT